MHACDDGICFQGLFSKFDVVDVIELSLGANMKYADMTTMAWRTKGNH